MMIRNPITKNNIANCEFSEISFVVGLGVSEGLLPGFRSSRSLDLRDARGCSGKIAEHCRKWHWHNVFA